MMQYTSDDDVFSDHFSFLIVDDHDFMQYLVMEALNSANAGKVERAFNGLEAIDALRSLRSVDFIITDFNMPKMNGLELLKAVRTGNANIARDTPVIMLSGFEDDDLLITAKQLDANGYIPKPVSRAVLVSRLNKIFMSEAHIKSVDEYQEIALPEIGGAFRVEVKPEGRSQPPSVEVPAEVKARGAPVPLGDVPIGSIIVEKVVTKNGVTLAEEGDQVTQQLIDFLIQTKEITDVHNLVVLNL